MGVPRNPIMGGILKTMLAYVLTGALDQSGIIINIFFGYLFVF